VPRTVRDMIRLVERDGWMQVGQVGSHRQYRRPKKPGRVTIAGKPSEDVYPKMERSILRQSGLIGGVQ
jgi:predicted RNA binding protein YcfA (HicA-like mRNA interferase family)